MKIISENRERAMCPTCAAGQTPDGRQFGIAELTYIVGEAICEFEGAGPDSISDEEVHKFLARVLDELQSAGVAEIKARLLAGQTVGEAYKEGEDHD